MFMMTLLPCSQQRLMSTKDCCFLLAGFLHKTREICSKSLGGKQQQQQQKQKGSKLLKGAYKCQSFISRDVSNPIIEMWKLQLFLNVLLCTKKEQCAKKTNSSFTDGLLHICGDLLVGLLHCFTRSTNLCVWVEFYARLLKSPST